MVPFGTTLVSNSFPTLFSSQPWRHLAPRARWPDPFDEHSDDELLAALRQVQLHRPVQEKVWIWRASAT